MRLFRVIALSSLLVLLFGEVRAQQDDQDKPEGGYGSVAELKRFVQVKGIWTKEGYIITAVKPDGPATKMTSADGKTKAAIEPGDVIVEVERTKIESQTDYARAMNGAKDPQRIEMRVRDRNSGNVYTWYAGSKDSPFAK